MPGMAQWAKGSGVATAAAQVIAVARIQSLAQELPYAVVAAVKLKKLFFSKDGLGVPVVAQQVTNPINIHEEAGLILGLIQQVKDPAVPRAVVQFTDAAGILHCCGCSVDQQMQF